MRGALGTLKLAGLQVQPPKLYDWFNIPMRIDFEIGKNWGSLVEVKMGDEPGRLDFEGLPHQVTGLCEQMTGWEGFELGEIEEHTNIQGELKFEGYFTIPVGAG